MSEPDPPPRLEFENLGLSYGSKSLWQGLSLTLNPGGKIAVTGRSGAGKSSLLRCVLGFLEPTTGRILVHGRELDPGSVWEIRKTIGYVPQEPELGNLTAEEFIRKPFSYRTNAGRAWEPRKLQSLCRAFLLDPALLAQPSRKLSGGEKQRVALISALMLDRDLYLMDEVTSALDEQAVSAVVEYFRSRPELTALFVAHDRAIQEVCDQVIPLDPAAAAEEGT